MLVTKASSLQTRAREPLSIYRTYHYGQIRCQLHILLPMPCRISLHFCALLFKYCFKHPNSKYIWLLIRSLMLWRLDPWLIDYGGVSWLAFNMWTLTSLASKCQYDWEPVSRLCGQVQLDQKVLTIVVDDLDVGEIAFQIIPSPARAIIS